MATAMKSYLGKVELLSSNPRKIRDNQFNALVESVQRDPEFLLARGVVVWQVPQDLGDQGTGRKSPFRGQKGRLVVLGGNMRMNAFRALGMTELKKEWIVEAKDENGEWWSPEKAERFVLVDNSQPGNSGDNDYEKLLEGFEEFQMRMSGIDFSEFADLLDKMNEIPAPTDEEKEPSPEDEVEEGEHGEKNPELEEFISERERTRRNLKYIDEFGFYLALVFETLEAKAEFIRQTGLTGKKGVTSMDMGSTTLVAVFESYDQKMEFCEKAGLNTDLNDPKGDVLFGMFCDGRLLAEKMGISLPESGLHFRNRVVDHQLEEMAMEPQKQKSEKEIAEEQLAKVRAEREELGMLPPKSEKKQGRRRGKKAESEDDLPPPSEEVSSELSYRDVADGEVMPSWIREEEEQTGDGFFVVEDDEEEEES